MQRKAMFWRLISWSLTRRRSRVVVALLAIVIGSAVVAGMAALFYDINWKMSNELRSYGANLILKSRQGQLLHQDSIQQAIQLVEPERLVGAAPYLYGMALLDGRRLVLVGTDFDQVRRVSPYWQVTGDWARSGEEMAMVGAEIAERLHLRSGDRIRITSATSDLQLELKLTGVVRTGDSEDRQLFVNLAVAQHMLGQPGVVNLAQGSVVGQKEQLDQLAGLMTSQNPELDARPIYQISRAEGLFLAKISNLVLLVLAIILLSTLLCVGSTMVTTVVERRQEMGLKKALGASDRELAREFLVEAAVLAVTGGLVGTGVGYLLAQLMGQVVFQTGINWHWILLPLVLVVALGVTGVACIFPIKIVLGLEPAAVLKGE